jgi:hypothetical protein
MIAVNSVEPVSPEQHSQVLIKTTIEQIDKVLTFILFVTIWGLRNNILELSSKKTYIYFKQMRENIKERKKRPP